MPRARRLAHAAGALVLGVLAAGALPGCLDPDAEPPPPDPALVETLVDAHLADARASATGADPARARRDALAARGTTPEALTAAVADVAADPAAAAALWSAVAGRLDAERMGGASPAAPGEPGPDGAPTTGVGSVGPAAPAVVR